MTTPETKPPTLDQLIERSLCSVKKAKMADGIPVLSSDDPTAIDQWRDALLAATILKGKTVDSIDTMSLRAKLQSCIKSLGTHGAKIPNPDVDSPPIWRTAKTNQLSVPGIITDSMLPDVITYSGNAADVPTAKFLMATFILDGVETTVLNELQTGKTSPVTKSLMASLITEDHLANLSVSKEDSASELASTPIHPLQKQIYFCEEGFDDVIIIPVASANLVVHMHSQSQQPGRWMRRELCKVGGANPVNGGSLCSDLGGNFQLFVAEPPTTQIQTQARRMSYGGPIYVQRSIQSIDVATFISHAPLGSSSGDLDDRLAEHRNYDWFAQLMLQPIFDAKDQTYFLPYKSDSESAHIVKYINASPDQITSDLCSLVAIDVIDRVKKHHKSLNEHIADKMIRDKLIEKMMEALL